MGAVTQVRHVVTRYRLEKGDNEEQMMNRVRESARAIEEKIIGYRRDFHRYAEAGWTEHRTASLVARRLVDLGLQVQAGREVVRDEDRMGLPAPEVLEEHW